MPEFFNKDHTARNCQKSKKPYFDCKGQHNSTLCADHYKDVKQKKKTRGGRMESTITDRAVADQGRPESKRILLLRKENFFLIITRSLSQEKKKALIVSRSSNKKSNPMLHKQQQ